MSAQLPLTLGLKDSAVFANFIAGPNAAAVSYLQNFSGQSTDPVVYLWGEAATGKSHLLQALCQAAGERDQVAVYLPMAILADYPREALTGLEEMSMICVDDLDAVAGDIAWEDALLRLFERAHASRCGIVMAAAVSIVELGLKLPQLRSRLAWGMAFPLQALSESDKLAALEVRARRRGIRLPAESARYLVKHYGSDSQILFNALETLDRASWVAKRRLTVPFIRGVLTATE